MTIGFLFERIRSRPEIDSEPWRDRIDRISKDSERKAYAIIKRVLGREPNSTDLEEIRVVSDSLSVTINFPLHHLYSIFKSGKFSSYFETKAPVGLVSRILDLYYRSRRKVEDVLGIAPKGDEKDPPLIYGAVVHNTPYDNMFGGAYRYGSVIAVLDTDSIQDRTTFTYGDSHWYASYGELAQNQVVGWEGAAALKWLRDKTRKEYVEAQIAGGVYVRDIKEIRFCVNSQEEGNRIMNLPEIKQLRSKYSGIKFSFVVSDIKVFRYGT